MPTNLASSPALRFCSLASCSVYGNAYYIESAAGTRILVDCGVPLRRLERELTGLGCPPDRFDAIFVTHEHIDHIRALTLKYPFSLRHRVPVFAPGRVWSGWRHPGAIGRQEVLDASDTVRVGDLTISALAKPHDAVEPVAYLVEGGGTRLAVVTDLGMVPATLVDELRGSDFLIFEANHDREMELRSDRAWPVIQRALSDHGHLSNEQAAAALARIITSRTQAILLAHLSLDCNRPELALEVVGRSLARAGYSGTLEAAPACGSSRLIG